MKIKVNRWLPNLYNEQDKCVYEYVDPNVLEEDWDGWYDELDDEDDDDDDWYDDDEDWYDEPEDDDDDYDYDWDEDEDDELEEVPF